MDVVGKDWYGRLLCVAAVRQRLKVRGLGVLLIVDALLIHSLLVT